MRRACPILLVALGCVPAPPTSPRLSALHDTYATFGLVQTGPVVEGVLREGRRQEVRRELRAGRCYHVAVLVEGSLHALDVSVVDPGGETLVERHAEGAHATVRVCPEADGEHAFVLEPGAGRGTYTLATWVGHGLAACSDRARFLAPEEAGREPDGTLSWQAQGDTSDGRVLLQGSCAPGDSPEHVYRLRVEEEQAQVHVQVRAEYDAATYVLPACDDLRNELGCSDKIDGDPRRAAVRHGLQRGEYYVVVDGAGGAAGRYELEVRVAPREAIAATCRQAVSLGEPAATERHDYFDAACAPGGGPEVLRRLEVDRAARVMLRHRGDGPVYVMSGCNPYGAPLACGVGAVTADLPPGEYLVATEGGGGRIEVARLGEGDTGCGLLDATAIGFGQVRGDTSAGTDWLRAGSSAELYCPPSPGHEAAFALELTERTRIAAQLDTTDHDGVLYLRRSCTDHGTTLACNDDAPNTRRSRIEATLDAGRYYLIVDGYSTGGGGPFTLTVERLAE